MGNETNIEVLRAMLANTRAGVENWKRYGTSLAAGELAAAEAKEAALDAAIAALSVQGVAGEAGFTEANHKALRALKVGEVLTDEQWQAVCAFVREQEAIIDAHESAAEATAAPGGEVDAAMIERALSERAFREDGALWPDAYSAEEQAAERANMCSLLSAALNTKGPGAYCRGCQHAGMSNCGYFDDCSGATCITCHRPYNTPPAGAPAEGDAVRALVGKWRAEIMANGCMGDPCACAYCEVLARTADELERAASSVGGSQGDSDGR